MKPLIVVTSVLLIALSTTLVAGCGPGSKETIAASKVKGSGKTEANNGSGSDTKDTPAKDVATEVTEAKADPSLAKGRVSSAYVVTGIAHAEKIGSAPPANKASATTTSTAAWSFTLKQDGKLITPTIEDKLAVTLNGDDAVATVTVLMRITKGGTEVAKFPLVYTYKPNHGDSTKIDLTGPHTETIKNGEEKNYTEKAAAQVTLNKGDYDLELTLTIATTGSVLAEANAKEVKLSLPAK
jgi:hypothetical protein